MQSKLYEPNQNQNDNDYYLKSYLKSIVYIHSVEW